MSRVGQVVLVKFPFTDLTASKKRPALVLNEITIAKIQLLQIAMITSRVDGLKFPKDVMLKKWQDVGLLHPSLVRLDKLVTLELALIDKVLGPLSGPDRRAVKGALERYFSKF